MKLDTQPHLNPNKLRALVQGKATLLMSTPDVKAIADYIERLQKALSIIQKPQPEKTETAI